MTYQVTHYEKYVPDSSYKEFESLNEFQKSYSVYWKFIEGEMSNLKVGEKVGVQYDDYINLSVKKV